MAIFRPPSHDEARVFARVLQASFNTRVVWDDWIARVGHKNLRVIEVGGAIVGGLGFYKMGQFFGGKSVPLAGVTGVGVALEHRGKKLAQRLVRATLAELAPAFPLAGLYASTATLYRSVGFEQAGARFTYRVAPDRLPRGDHELPCREVAGFEELAPLYEDRARAWTGHLDRSRAIWERTLATPPDMPPVRAYVVGDTPQGYAVIRCGALDFKRGFPVYVRDLLWSTPVAARRLVALLRDLSSLAEHVEWAGCAADPLVSLLPEQSQEVTASERWMLRVLDVRGALEARGYPPISTEIHLRVRDELLPHNDGDFVLTLDRGSPSVARGGRADVTLDARALAALYSGFAHPTSLPGLVTGDATALAAAFAGPEPWCVDHY